MRVFRSEFGHEYGSYSFGYTIHGEREPEDQLAQVYADGFLPYAPPSSDNAHLNQDLFYMSRSVRIPVTSFVPSSENRRIFRKFDGQFTIRILGHDELRSSPDFSNLLLAYFAERHGADVMPAERLKRILERDLPMRGIAYELDGTTVAYVLEIVEESFSHYWYSCYDLSYAGSSLGMWLMLDAARRAAEDGRTHLYLGTAYGEKARYKTNVPGLEFWDGNEWRADAHQLEALMRKDG
jgi:arginyl-tRNA--protein-N-Asp/Glu arginylyltransferase